MKVSNVESIIKFFYILCMTFMFQWVQSHYKFLNININLSLWPTKLLLNTLGSLGHYLLLLFLSTSYVFGILKTESKLIRTLVFLSTLLIVSAKNSYGKINHSDHIFIYTSFFFIFFPSKISEEESNSDKFHLRLLQFFLLFIYFLTGYWKVVARLLAIIKNEWHYFNFNSFSMIVAGRFLETNGEKGLLTDFFVKNQFIGFLTLNTGILLEFLCPLLIFILRSRIIGLFLLALHIGNVFIFNISFQLWAICILLLFCYIDLPPIRLNRVKNKTLANFKGKPRVMYSYLLLIIVYFFTANIIKLRNGSEIYPVFSWSLFSRVPEKIRATCYISASKDKAELDRIKDSISSRNLLDKACKTFEQNSDTHLFDQYAQTYLKDYKSFRVYKESFSIIDRYWGDQSKNETIMWESEIPNKVHKENLVIIPL